VSPEPDKPKSKEWPAALRESGPFLGLGSSLAASVLLAIGIGHWVDKRFGTDPLWLLVGAGFGLLAAVYHFYKMYLLVNRKR
jgi:F0F1-type ATP synthase assembly protein I